MREDRRRQLGRLIWAARLRTFVSIAVFFGFFAAIYLLVFADEYENQPPETATLLSQRVSQDEIRSRWVWIVELEGERIRSVSPRHDITFEAGKLICVQRRTGERLGLEGIRVLYEGRCDR